MFASTSVAQPLSAWVNPTPDHAVALSVVAHSCPKAAAWPAVRCSNTYHMRSIHFEMCHIHLRAHLLGA